MCILATDQQLVDMERFCTGDVSSVLSVDQTWLLQQRACTIFNEPRLQTWALSVTSSSMRKKTLDSSISPYLAVGASPIEVDMCR